MGDTGRLYYLDSTMFVFGADLYLACSGLDIVGRQFVFGVPLMLANFHIRASNGRELKLKLG